MNGPIDDLGKVRHRVRELIGAEYPNGKKFSEEEVEQIIRAIESTQNQQ